MDHQSVFQYRLDALILSPRISVQSSHTSVRYRIHQPPSSLEGHDAHSEGEQKGNLSRTLQGYVIVYSHHLFLSPLAIHIGLCTINSNGCVEGILVAKKDFNAPTHVDLHKIPNLHVIKACQSLSSRGYVKTQFSWQYYYYTLTNEGIGNHP